MRSIKTLLVACVTCSFVAGCGDKTMPNQKAIDAISHMEMSGAKTTTSDSQAPTEAIATFGNGCYWCTEAVFQELEGVGEVISGFSGGEREDVTYLEVCSGETGHAEVVKITYDPTKISYATLLQAFFLTHDPTTLNRQGADRGTQYRSAIFYHDEEQKRLAEQAIEELTKAEAFEDPIVTEVTAWKNFIVAPKHQDYFDKNPNDSYCQYNIPSKIEKIRKVFKDQVKAH